MPRAQRLAGLHVTRTAIVLGCALIQTTAGQALTQEDVSGPQSQDGSLILRLVEPVVAKERTIERMTASEGESARPRGLLRRLPDRHPADKSVTPDQVIATPVDAPLGFAGSTESTSWSAQPSDNALIREDRWRIGFPPWDRYGKGHPWVDDYPYGDGHWWDPYNLNLLKGDYPIIGQYTFLNITGTSQTLFEAREVPTATTPFESTDTPGQNEFFGNPEQFFFNAFQRLSFNLAHGDAAFKPFDWQVRITPVWNQNYLDVEELGVVSPDVRRGTTRDRRDFALDEWFVECKLADLTCDYDFVSVRAGSQLFTSDFRGFVFSDTNRAVRLFGTHLSNRDQFNLVWFDQTEKETNSTLNTFDDRHQNVIIANYYRQDFIWPGYTAQLSFHYNRDQPSFLFDANNFLVRPDPAGIVQPHEVNAYYLGWAGDGHIDRLNLSHAFYWVLGEDELNPIAGRYQHINAQMAAADLSYDRDYIRFRTSFLWASGDDDPLDGRAEGFDSIFDNPNFAGGQFSYWQRQAVKLFGVNLVNRESLLPNLRSSKIQGQSNFVNPGLLLFNAGIDAELTPKLRLITNANFLWFDHTDVLQQFVFQGDIEQHIGTDLSVGIEYRPFLNNNVIVIAGFAALLPGDGFRDLYNDLRDDLDALHAGFLEVMLTF
jgi:hypothetical protein